MPVDDLPGDVQPESQTAVVRRRDLSSAMESLEDLSQLVLRNADAPVAHRGHDLIAAILHVDVDLASLRRVLDRVLQKVAQNLLQAIAIANDHRPAVRDVEMEPSIA